MKIKEKVKKIKGFFKNNKEVFIVSGCYALGFTSAILCNYIYFDGPFNKFKNTSLSISTDSKASDGIIFNMYYEDKNKTS